MYTEYLKKIGGKSKMREKIDREFMRARGNSWAGPLVAIQSEVPTAHLLRLPTPRKLASAGSMSERSAKADNKHTRLLGSAAHKLFGHSSRHARPSTLRLEPQFKKISGTTKLCGERGEALRGWP